MVKLFQMLQGDAEYFGLLLIKSGDPQSYSNGHKRSIFTSVYHEIPNFCVPRMVSQLWNWLQIISNGQIMLCRKKCVIFQSNAPCTCTLCTFWGLGITPKTPSGGHASLGTTQQSQRVTLNNLIKCHIVRHCRSDATVELWCESVSPTI